MATDTTKRSGQITVTTAGTAVQGTDAAGEWWYLFGKSDNTGSTFVGHDGAGDVTATNGYELVKGANQILIHAQNLKELWFDAANNGDVVCWFKVL